MMSSDSGAAGYHLIHVVACGTSDLIFVRQDVLEAHGQGLAGHGLAAVARYQEHSPVNSHNYWPPDGPKHPKSSHASMTGEV